ncbi:MAG: hypothetical protein PHX30_03555 [Candidatus Pacebacteria bacterium]|nr:hypothetical protein [Candidatus Paceibacterota bacterium]
MNEIKKKFTLNISIAILLVLAFIYIGTEYLAKDVETYSGQIVSDRQAASLQKAKIAQLPELKKQYEENSVKINEIFETVIDKEHIVDFIKESEETASRDRVKLKIKTMATQAVTAVGKDNVAGGVSLTSSSFNFTVGGKFDNVMRFLGEMENFKYCLDIENVNMTYDDFDENNKNMIILTFDVKLYQEDSQK